MSMQTLPGAVEAPIGLVEGVAHIVRVAALVRGGPVEALCGVVFTPTRSAANLPICRQCKAVYDDDLAMSLGADQVGSVTP